MAVDIEDLTKWRRDSHKRERNERKRAKRRREKVITAMDYAIGVMWGHGAEPQEIRDLMLYFAREANAGINERDEILAEIEATEQEEDEEDTG